VHGDAARSFSALHMVREQWAVDGGNENHGGWPENLSALSIAAPAPIQRELLLRSMGVGARDFALSKLFGYRAENDPSNDNDVKASERAVSRS
jgi:hypothetical protein